MGKAALAPEREPSRLAATCEMPRRVRMLHRSAPCKFDAFWAIEGCCERRPFAVRESSVRLFHNIDFLRRDAFGVAGLVRFGANDYRATKANRVFVDRIRFRRHGPIDRVMNFGSDRPIDDYLRRDLESPTFWRNLRRR